MIEYVHTLERHRKTAIISIAMTYPVKIFTGIACAIASVICLAVGISITIDILIFLGLVLLVPALYFLYFWARVYRVRTVTMLRLFKKHSVTAMKYNFYYEDGAYHDVCKTIPQGAVEFRKKDIQKTIYTKNNIYIKLFNGKIITLPNQKDIADLLRS